MRCIMCGKTYQNGTVIMGNRDNYRICKKCIDKYIKIKIPILYKNARTQKTYETKMKKIYLQEQIDKKLWEWMR